MRGLLGARAMVIAIVILGCVSRGDASMDGDSANVIEVVPAADRIHVALYVPLEKNSAVGGVRWYCDDERQRLHEVLIGRGLEDGPGDSRDAALVDGSISREATSWNRLVLSEVAGHGKEGVYVYCEFHTVERGLGLQDEGGAGIEYRKGCGLAAWMSNDGVEWVRLHPGYHLAVEPMLVGIAEGSKALRGPEEAAEAEPQIQTTALLPAQPNPFNPSVQLQFALREGGPVQLAIYNVRGELVYRLTAAQYPVGVHTVEWQGQDQRGQVCPSGVYFARFKADGVVMTQNLTLVR